MTALVIGGANVDVKARSSAPVVPGTSNPGTVTRSPGGVGRNVAENLARLGTPTRLLAAVGDDPDGDELVRRTGEAGVDVTLLRRTDGPTGTYLAVLDADGELVVAVSAMAATESLTGADVRRAASDVSAADLVVLDGNLPREALVTAWDLAVSAGVRVVLEPVSVPKAEALADLVGPGRPLFVLTPNEAELAALGSPQELLDRGVQTIWVRRGARGSTLVTAAGEVDVPPVPTDVVDVTGAGDASLGAFCHGVLTGADLPTAARMGSAAASLTIASPHTVRPDLDVRMLR